MLREFNEREALTPVVFFLADASYLPLVPQLLASRDHESSPNMLDEIAFKRVGGSLRSLGPLDIEVEECQSYAHPCVLDKQAWTESFNASVHAHFHFEPGNNAPERAHRHDKECQTQWTLLLEHAATAPVRNFMTSAWAVRRMLLAWHIPRALADIEEARALAREQWSSGTGAVGGAWDTDGHGDFNELYTRLMFPFSNPHGLARGWELVLAGLLDLEADGFLSLREVHEGHQCCFAGQGEAPKTLGRCAASGSGRDSGGRSSLGPRWVIPGFPQDRGSSRGPGHFWHHIDGVHAHEVDQAHNAPDPGLYKRLLLEHFGGLLLPHTAPQLHASDLRAPARRLRVFLYRLPPRFHAHKVTALTQRMHEGGGTCSFGLGLCSMTRGFHALSLLDDFSAEVVILAKFLAAALRGGVLTSDAEEADVFLVPWLTGASTCARTRAGGDSCGRLEEAQDIKRCSSLSAFLSLTLSLYSGGMP